MHPGTNLSGFFNAPAPEHSSIESSLEPTLYQTTHIKHPIIEFKRDLAILKEGK